MKDLISQYIKAADTYFMLHAATNLYHYKMQALVCLRLAREIASKKF